MFVARRQAIAARYDHAFAAPPLADRFIPLGRLPDRIHAYHLYVVRLRPEADGDLVKVAAQRKDLYLYLRERQILTQVHYIPVHWQPYYRHTQGTCMEACPGANGYYAGCLSLPMFPKMSDADVERVIAGLRNWAVSPG
jgi:dTDP-4-amino-4,6-dideoxygalactose transaminase